MSLAKRIAACRKQAGLSQEKLAERMGVSQQTISRRETGEARPDLEKFEQLCGVFSVSADAPAVWYPKARRSRMVKQQSRPAKARFRMAASVVLAAAGVLLVAAALLFALMESQQPYQSWYTVLGPYASHLFCTWRVWLLVLGMGMAGAGGVCIRAGIPAAVTALQLPHRRAGAGPPPHPRPARRSPSCLSGQSGRWR